MRNRSSSHPVTTFLFGLIALVFTLQYYDVVATAGFVPAFPTLNGAFLSPFMHDPSNFWHVGGNLAFLLVYGFIIEPELGSLRFAALYAASGAAGMALHYVVDPGSANALVGASGSLFGLMAMAAVIRPRLLGFAVLFMLVNVFYAFHGVDGISFGCHIGGFLVGVVAAAILKLQGEIVEEA